MKQNITVLNLQPWLLKKNLAEPKKNNKKHRLLLGIIVFISLFVLIGFVKYSQSVDVAMHDKGFNTAVFFYLHSNSGYAKELHG
tara:strand:- start:10753 stop:11004 length:252 start_codon:yes stop_codon:yes gene_type:complete